MTRTLSLAHLTLLDVAPPELVRAAAEAGFAAVGVRLGRGAQPSDPVWDMLGDTSMRRQTRERLDETGLRVLEVEGISIVPDRSVADMKRLHVLLESAAWLGARFITVASFEPDATRTADELARVCQLCRPFDVQPVLEFFARSEVKNLATATRLVEQPGCESAGVLLDTLHLFRSGGELSDPRRVTLIQIADAPLEPPSDEQSRRGESRHRLLPGQGELPLVEVLRKLPRELPISVESPSDRLAGLPAAQRARLVRDACMQVFSDVDSP